MMAALAAAMPVSGAIAWLLLLSVFPREAPGRLIATSAMVVAYPYAALLVYAAGYAASPIGRFDQWHVQWYLMAVLALTSSAVLSILGWLFFARGAKQYRRTLGAIIVTASIAGLCLVVSGHEQVTAEALRNSFAHAMPVIIPASFLFALLILRAQSGPDSMAKALFGAVMVAQFACVLPIFAAVSYPWAVGGRWWAVAANLTFVGLFVFAPAVLLLFLHLYTLIRRSRPGERSYEWEAEAALLIGAGTVLWTADVMWSTNDQP